jgi:hypothetical protein
VEALALISSVMELDFLLISETVMIISFIQNEHGDSGGAEFSIMPPRLFSWRICGGLDQTYVACNKIIYGFMLAPNICFFREICIAF